MKLVVDEEKLRKLLTSFSSLTGLRIALFDSSHQEILSVPPVDCPFCQLVQSHRKGKDECEESNAKAFQVCEKSSELYRYACHAGLYEAMINLQSNGLVVGYLMFGQISPLPSGEIRRQKLLPLLKDASASDSEKKQAIDALSYQDEEKLESDSIILLALAKYAMSEQMLSYRKDNLFFLLDNYLLQHIKESIYVQDIADYFQVSRSSLYLLFHPYLPQGIASYIEQKRLEEAQRLLRENNDKISDISGQVGFDDYNYFCRRFHKAFGLSPREYRQKERH